MPIPDAKGSLGGQPGEITMELFGVPVPQDANLVGWGIFEDPASETPDGEVFGAAVVGWTETAQSMVVVRVRFPDGRKDIRVFRVDRVCREEVEAGIRSALAPADTHPAWKKVYFPLSGGQEALFALWRENPEWFQDKSPRPGG